MNNAKIAAELVCLARKLTANNTWVKQLLGAFGVLAGRISGMRTYGDALRAIQTAQNVLQRNKKTIIERMGKRDYDELVTVVSAYSQVWADIATAEKQVAEKRELAKNMAYQAEGLFARLNNLR